MMDTRKLVIEGKIERWDEGIPLGNGELGTLLFGDSARLILSLDRGDVWDRNESPEFTKGFTYDNLIRLAKKKDSKTIRKIFDEPYARPSPTKLPVGKIVFTAEKRSEAETFELNLETAEASFRCREGTFRTFNHATEGYGMIRTEKIERLRFEVQNPKYGRLRKRSKVAAKYASGRGVSNKLTCVKYHLAERVTQSGENRTLKLFVQKTGTEAFYGVCIGFDKRTNEYAYYAAAADTRNGLIQKIQDKVTVALNTGYENSFTSHLEWWKSYHAKSCFRIPDKEAERFFHLVNYYYGSASRRGCYPMPLQGLWTACDDRFLPPWKGDYHNDLNTELTYSAYLVGNRLEQGLSFLDYLVSLMPRAKEFASSFYGAEGICFPSVMDVDGYALGGWPMYSLSPTNQLWLCQIFEKHFTYTGDTEFLNDTAYPFIEQSAKFIASILKESEEGYLKLPISSSPEIHDNTPSSFLTPNSNYDLALIRYIFTKMIRLSEILGKDATEWKKFLDKTEPLATDADGVLLVSADERLTVSHRHLSHAMAIYPLKLFNYRNAADRRVIDATIEDLEKLGSKFYTGYTFAWMAQLCAARKDGEGARKYLDIFRKNFCSVNGFHLNGDFRKKGYSSLTYRPFTLEGNFYALSAFYEMLICSDDGIVELFPAVPSDWKDVEFERLRATGGILVSAKRRDGVTVYAKFEAEADAELRLADDFSGFVCSDAERKMPDSALGAIALKKGETITFEKITEKQETKF